MLSARRARLQIGRGPPVSRSISERTSNRRRKKASVFGPRRTQHQPVDALGVLYRQHLAHGAAGRMAAPMDACVAQPVDQLQGVVRPICSTE